MKEYSSSSADADDPLGVVGERRGRVEALDPARLHAARAVLHQRRAGGPRRSCAPALGAAPRRGARCPRPGSARKRVDEQRSTPGPARGSAPAGEAVEGVDVDVGVAALAERVGQRLDVAQHAAGALAWGSTARRSRARRAGGAWPRACRGRARCRSVSSTSSAWSNSSCARTATTCAAASRERRRRRVEVGDVARPWPSRAPSRCSAVDHLEDDALAQPAAADLQRQAEPVARPPRGSGCRRAAGARARGRARSARATSATGVRGEHAQRRARASRARARAPTSRRSEVALPPTATRQLGGGTSRPSKAPPTCWRTALSSRAAGGSERR